jgi:MSHA biogenesis protein MshQ
MSATRSNRGAEKKFGVPAGKERGRVSCKAGVSPVWKTWARVFSFFALLLAATLPAHAAIAFRSASDAAQSATTGSTIAYMGAGAVSAGTGGDRTPSLPAGIAADDLLLCFVASRDNVAPTMPGPWVQRYSVTYGADLRSTLFWKIAGTAEPAPTVTYTGSAGVVARCLAFRGIDTASPFDAAFADPANVGTVANDDKMTTGSLTNATAGAMILIAGAAKNDVDADLGVTTTGGLTTWSNPGVFSLYNAGGGSANDVSLGVAYAGKPTAGTSIGPLSLDTDTNAATESVILALKPAVAGSANVLTIAKPAGTVSGDVMVASIVATPDTIGITAPLGWTLVRDTLQTQDAGSHLITYYRADGGSEPASYTWTFSATHSGAVGGIATFSGVDTANPLVASGAQLQNGNTATTHRAPGILASAGDMLVTVHEYQSSGTWTPPAGMTEAVDRYSGTATGAAGVSLEMNYLLLAATGDTGNRDATASNDGDEGASQSLALRPSAAPAVTSISLASSNPTNPATVVSWTVIFNRSVTGVDAGDFALVPGGGVSGSSIAGVSGSGTTWTVTANTGSGTGTLGLNLVDDDSIIGGGLPLGGTGIGNGNFTGEVYTVEAPMTCISDDFASGVLDTSLWSVMAISGTFTPQVVNVGGGDYRLRLTDTATNESTFAQLTPTFPGAGNKIVLEIDYFAYGGTGADGIAVTFSDSAVSSTTGGFGGSLGYAQRTGVDGFGGGWLGIGLDEYGNFPNPTEGRTGYPAGWAAPAPANVAAGFYKTNVSVRGSGSAQTGYSLLANTGVLATPVNPPSGAAGATPYRYRFTIDHSNGINAWVTVERDTTATGASYQVLVPTFDVKAANSGQAAVPLSWLVSFTGSTGGATNFHEFKRVSVCANTIVPAGGPHHLEILHASGTGVTCAPSTLTIKACADDLVPCTPHTGGVSGTLSAAGAGMTVNWDGGADFAIPAGSSTITKNVQVTTAGNVVFDATSTPAAPGVTGCNFGTPACTFTAADAGFLVTAPNHAAETASVLTVQAVRKSDNSLQCVPAFASVAKTVNLKCAYANPSSGTLPVRIAGVALNAATDTAAACDGSGANVQLNFDASGIAAPSLQYADVGEMQVSAGYTGTAGSLDAGLSMAGSGSFIVAPAAFSVTGVTAGPIKAGNDFSATVTALNASGNATPNFGNESPSEGVTLVPTLVSPVGGANAALGNGVIAGASFANGVAAPNNLNWGEVGNITLDAALTSGSYLGSGLDATGSSATVGAFIPDHFDTGIVLVSGVPMACPSGLTCPVSNDLQDGFVYSGQAFSVRATARNLGGGTTANYDGALGFSKATTLTAWDARGSATTQNPGGGTLANNSVAAAAFSAGVATTAVPTYTFAATTAPTDIYIRAEDTDSVSSRRLIDPATSVEGGVKVVSGRIKVSNAYGSELLPLTLTATAQYYTATGWVNSITDSVTNLVLAASYPVGAGSTAVTLTPSTGDLSSGKLTIRLGAPGVTGTATITPTTAPGYLPVTSGTATFGVYKGNNSYIYRRESY